MAEDRKFRFKNGKFVNRVSGEAIPDEEPVIIFRARDQHALDVLRFYQGRVSEPHHVRAVQDRINEFQAFADEYPEAMKEPGVTRHIVLNEQVAFMLRSIYPDVSVTFDYTNHRGETKTRSVFYRALDFGSNEWYPEPQWFLRGFDREREVIRSFALRKIDMNTIAFR